MLSLRVRTWCALIAAVTKGPYSVSNSVPSVFCPPSSSTREQQWPGKGVLLNRRSNQVSCFFSLSFSGERALSSTRTRTTSELRMAATSALSASRRLGKLGTSSTIFFACDIQERFRNVIHNMPAVISTARFLLDVSKAVDVPSIATEQYPKALLRTVSELNIGDGPEQHKIPVFEKKLFSMCTGEVLAHLDGLASKPTDVVLFGIEAHVCITQTCLDLLEQGYGVHVVCDGVSSQNPYDRTVGLQRMQQVGAFLTTAEQVAFQLAGTADHPSFKTISGLVKKRSQEGNAFSAMSSL